MPSRMHIIKTTKHSQSKVSMADKFLKKQEQIRESERSRRYGQSPVPAVKKVFISNNSRSHLVLETTRGRRCNAPVPKL